MRREFRHPKSSTALLAVLNASRYTYGLFIDFAAACAPTFTANGIFSCLRANTYARILRTEKSSSAA